jgi:hypothetical protein
MENVTPGISENQGSAEGTKRDENRGIREVPAATEKENPAGGVFTTKRQPEVVPRRPLGGTTTDGIGWARSPDPPKSGVPENPPENPENRGSQRATPEVTMTDRSAMKNLLTSWFETYPSAQEGLTLQNSPEASGQCTKARVPPPPPPWLEQRREHWQGTSSPRYSHKGKKKFSLFKQHIWIDPPPLLLLYHILRSPGTEGILGKRGA